VKIYPTKLEVVSSTAQYNLPLLGNYILKPNQGNRGPIYQNEESGEEILFDGRRFWRSINEDYLVIPTYPKDDGVSVVLITGGDPEDDYLTSELWRPNKHCLTSNLTLARRGHVQFGRTVCGGIDQGAKRTCETLGEDMKWFMDNITLQVDREGSIVYANNNDIFVIGGEPSRNTMEAIGEQGISSIENVNNVPTSTGSTIQTPRSSRITTKKMECFQNGLPSPCTSTQKTTIGLTMSTSTTDTTIVDTKLVKLQQNFLASCGIQHGEDLIITGGKNSETDVYKYSILENGNMKTVPLPSLHDGRYAHGCTSYMTDDNVMMYVVSGGIFKLPLDGPTWLGSTEVLAENGNSWTKIENSLLIPVAGLRLVTLDNTVYAFGGKTKGDDTLSNIYEMDVKHRFKFHSFMENYRYLFGLSVIKVDKLCGENFQE